MSKLATWAISARTPNVPTMEPQTARQKNIIRLGLTQAGASVINVKRVSTFTETKGTLFYRRRPRPTRFSRRWPKWPEAQRIVALHAPPAIRKHCARLAAGCSTCRSHRRRAFGRLSGSRGQLDGLWAYVGNKVKKGYPETEATGQFWRSTLLDMDTRLRVARASPNGNGSFPGVFQTLKERRGIRCATADHVDGWGGIDDAMVTSWPSAGVSRPRSSADAQTSPTGWQYLQFIKHRDAHGIDRHGAAGGLWRNRRSVGALGKAPPTLNARI